jgi:hypothetical protein
LSYKHYKITTGKDQQNGKNNTYRSLEHGFGYQETDRDPIEKTGKDNKEEF